MEFEDGLLPPTMVKRVKVFIGKSWHVAKAILDFFIVEPFLDASENMKEFFSSSPIDGHDFHWSIVTLIWFAGLAASAAMWFYLIRWIFQV